MDLEDEDLFAVFDSDGGKAATSGVASRLLDTSRDEEKSDEKPDVVAAAKPIKFDSGRLVAEICGGGAKRTNSCDGESNNDDMVKKVKKDEEDETDDGRLTTTLMTGLSDRDIERNLKGESDWETQARQIAQLEIPSYFTVLRIRDVYLGSDLFLYPGFGRLFIQDPDPEGGKINIHFSCRIQ
jgi:hypothetical protein